MRKLLRILAPLVIVSFSLTLALAFPILFEQINSGPTLTVGQTDWMTIQPTFAQSTTTELSAEVASLLDSIIPGWTVYVVFGLLVAFGIYLFSRFIRGAKSS